MINSSNPFRTSQFSPIPEHSIFRTSRFWIALGLCAILYLPSLFWALGLDQNIFAEIGALLLDGKKLYVDAWDVKPPNIFYTYAIFEWVFGRNDFAVRLSDYLFSLAACGAIFIWVDRLVSRFSFGRWASFVASLLFLLTLLSLGLADTAQTESYSLVFLLLAAYFTITQRPRLFMAGIAIGLAAFYKTTNAIFLLPIIIELWSNPQSRARWVRNLSLFLGGFFLACGLELGLLALQGNLQEYLTITWDVARAHPGEVSNLQFLDLFRALWTFVDLWSLMLLAGIILALVRQEILRTLRLPVLYLVSGLAAVYLQNKGWGYQYVVVLPGLIALCAIASPYLFHRIWLASKFSAFMMAFIVAVATLVLSPSTHRRIHYIHDAIISIGSHSSYLASLGSPQSLYYPPCTEELASYLQTRTTTTDRIFIFGEEPGAYWKSDRQPGSRYIYALLFTSGVIPQHDLRSMSDTLSKYPPSLFIVERFDTLHFRNTPETSESLLRDDSDFHSLNSMLLHSYLLQDTICGKFLVYKRQ